MKLPPAFAEEETGTVHVVVETPKDSRHKYTWDEDLCLFRLKRTLPAGMVFPTDFGFIPGTRGGDGDPLDVLLFGDAPAAVGVVAEAVVIGMIECEQTRAGTPEPFRNDRLLAVMTESMDFAAVRMPDHLGNERLMQLSAFFEQYHRLSGGSVKLLGVLGPDDARAALLAAC